MGWADTLSEYDFKDSDLPQKGQRAYYRIKQLDMDGTFEYSKTVSVSLPQHNTAENEKNWRAFPNPTAGNRLSLDLHNRQSYGGEPVTVRLYMPSQSSYSLSTTVDKATEIKLDELIAPHS